MRRLHKRLFGWLRYRVPFFLITMCPYITLQLPYLGTFYIPSYSFFAFVGLFFTMVFLNGRLQKREISFERFLILMLFMGLGVGVGSKALFILTKIPEILQDFSLQKTLYIIWTSGFVFYGGLLGAVAGSWCFAHLFRIPFYSLMEVIVPSFPLFHFWGRIGCFFAGCCYGREASWGVPLSSEPGIPRIPIQLIEAACLALIFIGLLLLERTKSGRLSLLKCYLLSYSVCRFVLEFFRGDEVRGIWFGLSTSQWISAGIFCSTMAILIVRKNTAYSAPPPSLKDACRTSPLQDKESPKS